MSKMSYLCLLAFPVCLVVVLVCSHLVLHSISCDKQVVGHLWTGVTTEVLQDRTGCHLLKNKANNYILTFLNNSSFIETISKVFLRFFERNSVENTIQNKDAKTP